MVVNLSIETAIQISRVTGQPLGGVSNDQYGMPWVSLLPEKDDWDIVLNSFIKVAEDLSSNKTRRIRAFCKAVEEFKDLPSKEAVAKISWKTIGLGK